MNNAIQRIPVMHRPCPVCECNKDQVLLMPFHEVIPSHKEKVSMPIVKCVSCGMVYADLPESVGVSCNEQYDGEQLRFYVRLATKAQYWAYRGHIGRRLVPPKPGQRLLDYGAGIGSLMLIARELGWDAYGVDPSPYATWPRDHLGLNVFVGRLDTSPYPDGFFDAIVTLSTLEHIYHLKHELAVIYRKLRPGGVFIVGGVPNFDSFENLIIKKFSTNWAPIFHNNAPPGHINFLTSCTMERLVKQAGFSRVKVDTYGMEWVSNVEVGKGRKQSPPDKSSNCQTTLSHPFLDSSVFTKNLGVRDVVFKWAVSAFMNLRLPFWGGKLFVIAEKVDQKLC